MGSTPLIKLQSLSKLCDCDVYAKCEHLNPNGTGKDRLALAMIKDAEENGSLPKGGGGYVVEGSSGSTTLALAPLVAAAGHKLVAVIPDDCAAEKRDAIRACPGVDVHVVQSAAISSPTHYVNVARKLAKELNAQGKTAIFADQFDNLCNWRTHLNTANEIRNEIGRVDDAIRVADQDALVMAHYLLRFEGLFLGSSSALNCVAALRAGAELRRSSQNRLTVVTVLCDGGARYLSRFWNRDFVEKRGLAWPPEDSGELAGLVERLVAREEGSVV